MNIEIVKQHRCFDGDVQFCSHRSEVTKTSMNFCLALPKEQPKLVLLWLSGLTCNEENFITKAGAMAYASQRGVVLLCPDTSPRGTNLPGEHDSWDFGSGAGFYLDATESPWSDNYRMASYITEEIPQILKAKELGHLPLAISGHSMGGHGALTLGIKHPELFSSISAFAPICNPMEVPWGQKAFQNYLGGDRSTWKEYDACQLLLERNYKKNILVDQGVADQFLEEQLKPQNLEKVCKEMDIPLSMRSHEGYDHSYYFISSFIEGHIKFHLEEVC